MENLLGIIAIISTFGFVPLTVWIANKAKLDRLKIERDMQRNAQGPQDGGVLVEVKALRAEVAALRDTSTQFDLSLEHAVQRLEERVNRGEKAAPLKSHSVTEEVQPVGLHRE